MSSLIRRSISSPGLPGRFAPRWPARLRPRPRPRGIPGPLPPRGPCPCAVPGPILRVSGPWPATSGPCWPRVGLACRPREHPGPSLLMNGPFITKKPDEWSFHIRQAKGDPPANLYITDRYIENDAAAARRLGKRECESAAIAGSGPGRPREARVRAPVSAQEAPPIGCAARTGRLVLPAARSDAMCPARRPRRAAS